MEIGTADRVAEQMHSNSDQNASWEEMSWENWARVGAEQRDVKMWERTDRYCDDSGELSGSVTVTGNHTFCKSKPPQPAVVCVRN
jgi:hypothetical protein